jgi:hypothetical protein
LGRRSGRPKPYLATSFWFAIGDREEARAQVHLIPTSATIDQLRRVAEVVKEFA